MKRLLVSVISLYLLTGCGSNTVDHPDLLYNRVWETHSAKSDTDLVDIVIFAEGKSGVGVFEKASYYHHESDLFIHTRDEKGMVLEHLQKNKKFKIKVKTFPCQVGDYQYCLEITGAPQGAEKYYSADGMETESIPATLRGSSFLKSK